MVWYLVSLHHVLWMRERKWQWVVDTSEGPKLLLFLKCHSHNTIYIFSLLDIINNRSATSDLILLPEWQMMHGRMRWRKTWPMWAASLAIWEAWHLTWEMKSIHRMCRLNVYSLRSVSCLFYSTYRFSQKYLNGKFLCLYFTLKKFVFAIKC